MLRQIRTMVAALFIVFSSTSCAGNQGDISPGPDKTPEPGWHREHWDAGYGSYASGGVGQTYTLLIPDNYGFTQKLGQGWVSADLNEDNPIEIDDMIAFGFCGKGQPWPDVNLETIKKQLSRAAVEHPDTFGPPAISKPTPVIINGVKYERVDITAKHCLEAPAKNWIDLHGFWMKSDKIMLNVSLLEPRRLQICEKIIASLRKD